MHIYFLYSSVPELASFLAESARRSYGRLRGRSRGPEKAAASSGFSSDGLSCPEYRQFFSIV